MRTGIAISVVYADADMLELLVEASNGAFGGTVEAFVARGEPATLAAQLHGFHNSPSDTRDVTIGSFDPAYAGGGVRLRFACLDRSGHAAVHVSMQTEERAHPEQATFRVEIEPAALDAFVSDLGTLGPSTRGPARLQGAL